MKNGIDHDNHHLSQQPISPDDSGHHVDLDGDCRPSCRGTAFCSLLCGIAHQYNELLTVLLANTDLALQSVPLSDAPPKELENIVHTAKAAADLTRLLKSFTRACNCQPSAKHLDLQKTIDDTLTKAKKAVRTGLDLVRHHRGDSDADSMQLRMLILDTLTEVITSSDHPPNDRTESAPLPCYDKCIRVQPRGLSESEDADRDDPPSILITGCNPDTILHTLESQEGIVMTTRTAKSQTSVAIQFQRNDGTHGKSRDTDWFGQGTVLLAEDERPVRDVTERMLQSLGFDVLIARDGFEAVEVYRDHAHEIVLVISDIQMPRLSGEEVIKEVHRIRSDAPVILSSGRFTPRIPKKDKRFAFLPKPYHIGTLRDTIRRVLS